MAVVSDTVQSFRYQDAGQDPLSILYTDKDCCNHSNPSKFVELFSSWSNAFTSVFNLL